MDPVVEQAYLFDLKARCNHAAAAVMGVNSALQAQDAEGLFYHLNALLSHAATASRVLWPSPYGSREVKARARARGRYLVRVLKVGETHPLKPRLLRNALEHFDEHLDAWAQESPHLNLAVNIVGPLGALGGPTMSPTDILTQYDPGSKTYYFRGQPYAIIEEVVNGIVDLRDRVEKRFAEVSQGLRGTESSRETPHPSNG